MKQHVKEAITGANGKTSSTRLFSLRLLTFFFVFNFMAFLGVAFLITLEADTKDLFVIAGAWIFLDSLFLLGIFAPKQLAKQLEVKELIALAKATTEKMKS